MVWQFNLFHKITKHQCQCLSDQDSEVGRVWRFEMQHVNNRYFHKNAKLRYELSMHMKQWYKPYPKLP